MSPASWPAPGGSAEGGVPSVRGSAPLSLALSAVALLLPFALLSWMVPIGDGLRISMDYPRVSAPQQQELLFSLVNGSFPLFVPGFAGGQSSGALTAGQLFHPITYLAAALPGYWEGRAQDLVTLLRLVSLGCANLALYRLLRRLVRGELVALLLATVTVFNLRMLNVFHGAAALEGFTGHLFTVAALGWCWLRPGGLLPRAAVVAATYCTAVSGHPQFAYYSLLGSALAALLMPALVQTARGLPRPALGDTLRYAWRMALLAGLGGALAAAYALPFQLDFMSSNMRVGRDYEFSLWWNDTLAGVLNNFFRPLRTATSVAFGGTALALVAALAPALALFGVRLARVTWAAWGALLVVVLHALGDLTPVHWLFWRYVPLFGSVRGPGRLTVVVPFLLLAILVGVLRAQGPRRGPLARLTPVSLLALLALAATAVHLALPATWTAAAMDNAPVNFPEVTADPVRAAAVARDERLLLGLGLLGLAALAAWGQLRERRPRGGAAVAGALAALAFGGQTWLALRDGIWTEVRVASPTLEEMRAEKRARLAFAANPGGGLYSATILRRLEHSCLDPFLARLYGEQLVCGDEDEAYRLMDAGRPRETVIVELGERAPPGAGDGPAVAGGLSPGDRLRLVHGSFNRVVLEARSAAPVWLELSFPWSRHWRATLDGEPAAVVPANGAYQAVRLPTGEHRVEFRYESRAAVVGAAISFLALFVCGAGLALIGLRGGARWAGLALSAALAAAGFGWWRASLYAGAHLGTEYEFVPPAPGGRTNLAFQRPNRMTPIYPVTWNDTQATGRTPDPWGSGNGVDGVRAPGRGFRTSVEPDPHWEVDLAGSPQVAEVVVYGGRVGGEPGARLAIELWTGADWERVAETDALDRTRASFTFAPRPASRVRLQALGTTGLAADEVEVYGPAD